MQRLPSRGHSSRPNTLQPSKSFTRYEPSPSPSSRSRANTIHDAPPSLVNAPHITPAPEQNNDIFESHDLERHGDDLDEQHPTPSEVDDLPVEIQSLVESFLESLGARVHPTPLSIDRLSQLFQDFYEHAESQISVHIAVLSSRFPSNQSSTPSVSSAGSQPPRVTVKKNPKSSIKGTTRAELSSANQQMLTASEITGRRKARRQLDLKRVALEEAVERRVCERVYSRIWRHRTADDEERDEKLRSRAAALALVGVDLRELLSTAMSDDTGSVPDLKGPPDFNDDSVRMWLASARRSLERMNEEKYPLGKLNHLTAAHRSIVETLQQMFPSASSADEVLPTLIYSIITLLPDNNHIVSNFNFIQRFRASSKVDGEAAYCLTNLEAAITFLETVDLSSIRPDEVPQGPGKSSSQPSTPRTDTPDPMYHGLPSHSDSPSSPETPRMPKERHTQAVSTRPRRLSILTQTRSNPFENQSDAVLKAADDALDTFHSALGGSFKFLFGRIKERQANASPHGEVEIAAPKTLEDAHRLVNPSAPSDGDEVSVAGSSVADQTEDSMTDTLTLDTSDASSRVLKLIGGRRSRERSIDSGRSADSASRKVSFADDGSSPSAASAAAAKPALPTAKTRGDHSPRNASSTTTATNPPAPAAATSTAAAVATTPSAYTAVESMRNLGNSLNPLRGLSSMGMMRGFGRSTSSPAGTPTGASASLTSPLEQTAEINMAAEGSQGKMEDEAEGGGVPVDLSGVAPAIERFVGCREARELNGFEIEMLLRDYQRLAGVLRVLGR